MKKYVLKTAAYSALYALLAYAEKSIGLGGLTLALCLALVFCRENLFAAGFPFIAVTALVHFDLWHAISVFCGAALVFLYAFVCYKFEKKYRIWVNLIVLAVARTPDFFLFGYATETLVYAAVSVPITLAYHYISVATAYPVLVRGARYDLSDRERIFRCLFCLPIAAALAAFSVFGVNFFFFIFILGCLLISPRGSASVLGFAVSMGVGASAITLNPYFLCATAAIGGGVCAVKGIHKFACGPVALAVYSLCAFAFGTLGIKEAVPAAVACLAVLLPDKIFYRAKGVEESFRGKFALRTLANRDREEVGEKLRSVATAFRRMKGIMESDGPREFGLGDLAEKVVCECCDGCGKTAVCREKIGNPLRYVNKLVSLGAERGRVNLLDVDGTLGAVCVRLPRMVNLTNGGIREYVTAKERRSGIEQGRDLVVGNLGGTAELLDELAASLSEGFDFDVEGEKRITEELACANIIAGDTAIYDGGEKITLSVRECDEKKPELGRIISAAAGRSMYKSEKNCGVNGTVNLVFRPLPVFGVLYGEKSVSKEEECGDAKQAVRIAPDKLMFVLSDGMGTGKEAHSTGTGTIALIETFYRAGFGHRTIFGSVSKLLSLRTKETFSALDVAIMDTQTGEIDFIKQGGRESYLFTSNGVEVIEGGSLPMGIIEDGEPLIVRRQLKPNDLAVMVSDGVADRLNQTDMTEIIGSLNTLNPQTIAEKIVENAQKKNNGKEDDMTAMAIRAVENGRRFSS